jgi:ABC-type branched-subunit amino acid transport system substrate-binding protein
VNLDVKEYVSYIKSQGYKSIALIATSSAFANAAVSLFKTEAPAAGVNLATVQTFAATDTDFSSQVHAAQASHADAVFVIGDFLGSVYKQARNVGLNVPFMYDASTTDPLLIKSLGQDSNGLVSFQTQATQLLDATTAPMTTWESEFKAAFPSPPAGVPSQFSLEGYEATYVVADAIKLALQHGSLTGASIKSALETISGFVAGKTDFSYAVPIGYPVTFSATDHAGDSTVTPVVVKNGIWVPQG